MVMNRWNIDPVFRVMHVVDMNKPHPQPDYTLTVIDFESIERKLESGIFPEASDVLSRIMG
jgi:hypothetical protein